MMNIPNEPEELPEWDKLPHHILLIIYLNLDKYDQCSMSMVCSSWAELFDHPELWRRISYPLFQTTTLKNVEPLFKEEDLIEKYGHMVKHLTVRVIGSICLEDHKKHMENLELLYSKTQLECLALELINGNIKSSPGYAEMIAEEKVLDLKIRDKQPKGPGVLLIYQKMSKTKMMLQRVLSECELFKEVMEYDEDNELLQIIKDMLPPPVVLRNLWMENKDMNDKPVIWFLTHLLNKSCSETLKELRIQWQLEDKVANLFKVSIRRSPNSMKAEIVIS